jgi:hypothetical protein
MSSFLFWPKMCRCVDYTWLAAWPHPPSLPPPPSKDILYITRLCTSRNREDVVILVIWFGGPLDKTFQGPLSAVPFLTQKLFCIGSYSHRINFESILAPLWALGNTILLKCSQIRITLSHAQSLYNNITFLPSVWMMRRTGSCVYIYCIYSLVCNLHS